MHIYINYIFSSEKFSSRQEEMEKVEERLTRIRELQQQIRIYELKLEAKINWKMRERERRRNQVIYFLHLFSVEILRLSNSRF